MNSPNQVKQAVPFFWVSNMESSARYYVEGLGFSVAKEWIVEGRMQWCWLQREGAAVMLQELTSEAYRAACVRGKFGEGVTIYFICEDALALYREMHARGIKASRPQVGNGMWVTELTDPDGYKLAFESPTEVPEETMLED